MGLQRPDTAAVELLRTQAFRQKSWDSLNIHGSKTWIHSVFWATRGTALKTRGESQLVITIQAPWFSFISLTWLERHFSPQWTSKLTVTRLAVSYFFSLRIQRVIHAPHMQSKFRVQFRVPHEETWAFPPPPTRFTYCSRAITPTLHWYRGDELVSFVLTRTKQEYKTQGSFSHGRFLISFLFCAT